MWTDCSRSANALHNIYPNEVLHYSQRAKGMGMYSFFQNIFGLIMTYGMGEALARIQWKASLTLPLSLVWFKACIN